MKLINVMRRRKNPLHCVAFRGKLFNSNDTFARSSHVTVSIIMKAAKKIQLSDWLSLATEVRNGPIEAIAIHTCAETNDP